MTVDQEITRRQSLAFVAVLLLALVAQTLASMRHKAVTVDEIMYIAAGYYHLETGDFGFNTTNPPLMKLAAGLPLLALDVELPAASHSPTGQGLTNEWQFSRDFLYQNGSSAEAMLLAARLPTIALALLLGIYVYRWSRLLYGQRAALFSLFLFSFSPNILAHSRLATQDLGLTAIMFIFCFHFWRFIQQQNRNDLLYCGLLFGLALLTKTLALFLIPISGIYAVYVAFFARNGLLLNRLPVARRFWLAGRPRLSNLIALVASYLVIGLLGLIVLNLGYGFQGSFSPVSRYVNSAGVQARLSDQHAVVRWAAESVLDAPVPLPATYVEGLKFQSTLTRNSRDIYFNGRIYDKTAWYYVPVAFLIKTPLALLIISILALAGPCLRRRLQDAEKLALIFIMIVCALFSYPSTVNIAVRYLLPIFPFLFLLGGRTWLEAESLGGRARLGMVVLASWFAVSSLLAYPNYLAYFNEAIGGPRNGYKYVVGTNLDLGQDLKALAEYQRDNNLELIKLGYYGSSDATHHKINYEYLPSVGLAPHGPDERWWYEMTSKERALARVVPDRGTYAISANLLVGRFYPNAYDSFRTRDPVAQIGGTIFIYEVK